MIRARSRWSNIVLRIWLNISPWAGDIIYHRGVILGLHGGYRSGTRSFLSHVLQREGVFNRSERTELGPHYFLGQPNKVDITIEKKKELVTPNRRFAILNNFLYLTPLITPVWYVYVHFPFPMCLFTNKT